ncbi:MAG: alkaline shock response membrane anchor protein AmaP [Clostridia bacterium]|nr:alkaline shock response membrane anchor protein AmaP [Clostridia bacterium]
MKLRIFDRILLGLLLIVTILFALALLAMSVNLVTFDMATAFLWQFYGAWQNQLILAGSGLVLLLIAFKLMFAGRKDRKRAKAPATAMVRQGEIGGTFISLSAIDTMIQKFCASKPGIQECQTSVTNQKGAVAVGLRLSLAADANVASLTDELQQSLKNHIETLTGVAVKEISILVENADLTMPKAEPIQISEPVAPAAEEEPQAELPEPTEE